MSFLDKLKNKVEEGELIEEGGAKKGGVKEGAKDKKTASFLQLDVDIYQTSSDIIIVAPIPGVNVNELDISIENENDVVTIQGKRRAPKLPVNEDAGESKYLRQECQWGNFYRQIILPQEINVAGVEAKFKKGILVLKLPLLRLQTQGRKKIEVMTDR